MRDKLKWEITVAIIVKVILLWLLWHFFFSAPVAKHMQVPAAEVCKHLLSDSPASQNPPQSPTRN